MYNNKLKAIVLPVVIALAIVLGMGINSLILMKNMPAVIFAVVAGSACKYGAADDR